MPNMHFLLPLLLAATSTTASIIHPGAHAPLVTELPPTPVIHKRAEQPCAQVSQSLAALGPEATLRAVPAKVAYDCLMSVPVDREGDVLQIKELKAFMEWQSNLAWLKQDIKWHHPVPVDILGGLDLISQQVGNGAYSSEFEVQTAISNLLTSSYDNHLGFQSDIGMMFSFQRFGARLVSVSKDGVALPELFVFSDVEASRNGPNFNISSVKTINGREATEFLNEFALGEPFHDPDARYNMLFPNSAGMSKGQYNNGGFTTSTSYAGETTVIGFSNGTTKSFPNIALINDPSVDFTGVTDGRSFFKKFCSGPPDIKESPTPTPTKETTLPTLTPTGYPKPAFINSDLNVGGYYINAAGYEDVAVLSIPGFQPEDPFEFQDVVRRFLADATSKNKKKLIVDLRYNGGGYIALGFDTFKQLFPTVTPYGAARYRAHEATSILSAAMTDFKANLTIKEEDSDLYEKAVQNQMVFDYEVYLNANNSNFKSYEEFYGPTTINGDTFQSIRRYNFSDIAGSPLPGFNVTGYRNNSITSPQPFSADSIIILQDGRCSSTCTVFAELMREQGHVQTIAIGGRPSTGAMQGIGGTRGSQVLNLDGISNVAFSSLANVVPAIDNGSLLDRVNNSIVGTLAFPEQLTLRSFHGEYPEKFIAGSVNSLNNLRQNDTSETPLEFVYEAADCRIFHTAAGYFDPTHIWKQVADVKWGNGKCVEGSMGDKSAISVVTKKSFNVKHGGLQVQAPKQSGTPLQFQGAAPGVKIRSALFWLVVMVLGVFMVL